jgi:hypothetical protein
MVEVFVTCPGCERSLKPQTEKCPECGATIRREYVSQSVKANVQIGQAYVNAQKIESANPAAVITLVMSVAITAYAYFTDLPHLGWFLLIPFTMSTATLLSMRRWFGWFGSYKSDHEDFVMARRKVKHALQQWLAVFVAQVTLTVLLLAWLIFHK